MARQKVTRERQAAPFPAFDLNAPKHPAPVELANGLAPFKRLIKELSEAFGPAGSEGRVRELVRDEIKGAVDQVRVDTLGNLIAQRRGSGSHRKKIMLAAHLDEPGILLKFIDSQGFARFGTTHGVKASRLYGARCAFENGTLGVIGREETEGTRGTVELSSLYIDVGAPGASAAGLQVGDAACFVREFADNGQVLIGKALNNRVGCAVLIETMRQLKKSPHDIYCVFTVQQNVGARGAGAAAFAIQPDMAFVVDAASACDVPGGEGHGIELGKGPAVKFQDEGALTSSNARQALLNAAREQHLPYQLDVIPRARGDSLSIMSAREGVPTGALAIPMRYVGSTSEMAHYTDTQNAVKLLVNLLSKPL